jgi:hypothetical protein
MKFARLAIATTFLMIFAAGQALAGGLIDTSYEGGWTQATFGINSQQLSRNPTWDPTVKVLYYADSEDGCEWNLVESAGPVPNAFKAELDNGFSGDYEMHIVAILDREWLDEDVDCEDSSPMEGDIMELTYDWYAIDDANNIWYMGEDTWDFEEGSPEGSFAAGCDGAEPGIVMPGGTPSKGTFYQQEYFEEEAEDWGKVLNYVELDDLDCMKTKEWTPLEPGEVEHKYYCEGVLVLIAELKGKTKYVEIYGNVPYTGDAPDHDPAPASMTPECPLPD